MSQNIINAKMINSINYKVVIKVIRDDEIKDDEIMMIKDGYYIYTIKDINFKEYLKCINRKDYNSCLICDSESKLIFNISNNQVICRNCYFNSINEEDEDKKFNMKMFNKPISETKEFHKPIHYSELENYEDILEVIKKDRKRDIESADYDEISMLYKSKFIGSLKKQLFDKYLNEINTPNNDKEDYKSCFRCRSSLKHGRKLTFDYCHFKTYCRVCLIEKEEKRIEEENDPLHIPFQEFLKNYPEENINIFGEAYFYEIFLEKIGLANESDEYILEEIARDQIFMREPELILIEEYLTSSELEDRATRLFYERQRNIPKIEEEIIIKGRTNLIENTENEDECYICYMEIESVQCTINTCCKKKAHKECYMLINNKDKCAHCNVHIIALKE